MRLLFIKYTIHFNTEKGTPKISTDAEIVRKIDEINVGKEFRNQKVVGMNFVDKITGRKIISFLI